MRAASWLPVVLGLGAAGCAGRQAPPVAAAATASPAPGSETVHVARGHYLVAVHAWESGDCAAADAAFARALIFDPGAAVLRQDRGRAQLACGDTVAGPENLRAAGEAGLGSGWGHLVEYLAVRPVAGPEPDPVAEAALPLAVGRWSALPIPDDERGWRGRWRAQVGDTAGALDDFAVGLPVTPMDTAAVGAMLQAAARLGRLWTAQEVLESVVGQRPDSAQLQLWRGDLASEVGDESTARAAYGRLRQLTWGATGAVRLEVDGGQYTAHQARSDLARLALRTGDQVLSAEVLGEGVADPSLEAGLLGLVGDTGGALALLDAVIAAGVTPEQATALGLRKAEVLSLAGDVAGAVAVVQGLPGLNDEARARLQARTLAQAGEHAEALALLEGFPDALGSVRMSVRLLLELERPAQALALADRGLVRWPGDFRLAERRLLALEALDRPEEALAAARVHAAAHPDAVDAVLVLGRLAPADESLAEVVWACLEPNPGEPELWLVLARERWEAGDADGAAGAAARAVALLRGAPVPAGLEGVCGSVGCAGG